MKSVGTLRKKGLGGAEHFMLKKDKSKKESGSSSPSSISTSHKSIIHSSPKSMTTTTSTPPVKVVHQAPITVDLHRFADDNLQPEECKSHQM
jgi:hypothetical protein